MGNVDGRVMDAYDLDLAEDTFDVAGSIAGVTILPDVGRALSEMVRVTKPGGCAVVVNFGPPEKAEFAGVFIGAMQAVVPGFTPTGEGPSPSFQLADPERMRHELADAGWRDVRVETCTWRMGIESGAHLLNVLRFANPMTAKIISDLTDQQEAAAEEAIDATLGQRSEGVLGAGRVARAVDNRGRLHRACCGSVAWFSEGGWASRECRCAAFDATAGSWSSSSPTGSCSSAEPVVPSLVASSRLV